MAFYDDIHSTQKYRLVAGPAVISDVAWDSLLTFPSALRQWEHGFAVVLGGYFRFEFFDGDVDRQFESFFGIFLHGFILKTLKLTFEPLALRGQI